MGSILAGQEVDPRMAELNAILGHEGRGATRSATRPCARCGQDRGHGHRWCADCREDGKREYNADYHRRNYQRLPPDALSAVRREVAGRRWRGRRDDNAQTSVMTSRLRFATLGRAP